MRLSKPSLSSTPWYLKPFFWRQKRIYGQVMNPALIWAKVPKLFLTVASLYGVINRKSSPLNPVLRSLVTVHVSQINACHFCVDINSATLIKRANSNIKLEHLQNWQQSDVFSSKEKAALEYAEKITYTDKQVDNVCFKQLKEHFDEKAIIELTALIAFQNLSSKFNSALDVDSQGFCMRK